MRMYTLDSSAKAFTTNTTTNTPGFPHHRYPPASPTHIKMTPCRRRPIDWPSIKICPTEMTESPTTRPNHSSLAFYVHCVSFLRSRQSLIWSFPLSPPVLFTTQMRTSQTA